MEKWVDFGEMLDLIGLGEIMCEIRVKKCINMQGEMRVEGDRMGSCSKSVSNYFG